MTSTEKPTTEILKLAISNIRPSPHPIRDPAINPATVDRYVMLMRNGVTFPPILVHAEDYGYVCIDGHQRLEAARRIGAQWIEAWSHPGGQGMAFWEAVKRNSRYGLALTPAETQDIVRRVVETSGLSALPDPVLAQLTGVDIMQIREAREQFEQWNPEAGARGTQEADV